MRHRLRRLHGLRRLLRGPHGTVDALRRRRLRCRRLVQPGLKLNLSFLSKEVLIPKIVDVPIHSCICLH